MNTKIIQKLKELPTTPGVYLYRNEKGKVIYVGKAVVLKNRVSSYFQNKDLDPKTLELVKNIANIEWIEVESEFEALVLEAELIKRYKPKYNIRWKDDKNYVYVKFSAEKYPRVSVVHQITDHEASYIGPFVESGSVKTILKLARHIYPYCTCSLPEDEICLYYHLGLCPGHGTDYISAKDYNENIKGLKKLFSGKTTGLEKMFKKEMSLASERQEYEKAARFRDKLRYLKRIKRTHLFSDRDLEVDAGLRELAKEIGLSNPPKRIESFDISNILGTAATGSMVVFKNGIASPRDYRRFQIKTVKSANDFAMMAEILGRRFSLSKGKKDLSFSEIPNLVILDGGKGQLSAVMKKVTTPEKVTIVALAKRLEEIFTYKNGKFELVRLPAESEALFLVQRIRDEAHRFAISYHRKLKGKELFETTIDAIPGVGPKTKKKLLSHFGSIKKIKEADIIELIPIVGEKKANLIKEKL